jgi:hypothetical protein
MALVTVRGKVKDDIVLRILGPAGTRENGVWPTGRPQQRLVLAVLAAHADQVVRVGDRMAR